MRAGKNKMKYLDFFSPAVIPSKLLLATTILVLSSIVSSLRYINGNSTPSKKENKVMGERKDFLSLFLALHLKFIKEH